MRSTPEHKIKRKVKVILDTYAEHGIYYYMPVPVGYGRPTLDYLGFLYGLGFAIETKAEGKRPTDRQLGTIADIERSGARVFVIDGVPGLTAFNDWCQEVVTRSVVV